MVNANFPTVVDRMDVTNDPTSAVTTWTTLVDAAGKSLVTAFVCHSGRTYELGRTDTGTANVTVENSDGRFDPTNTTSPLNSAGKRLLPMRRYSRQATWNAVTYDVFTGHVERYPQKWTSAGFLGSVGMTCVDALSPLARQKLRSMYRAEVLADGPIGYFPLAEEDGSASAGDVSLAANPPAVVVQSKAGGGSYAFGADGPIPLVDSGTALSVTRGSSASKGYLLQIADRATGPIVPLSGFTAELWFKLDALPAASFAAVLLHQSVYGGGVAGFSVYVDDSGAVNVRTPTGGVVSPGSAAVGVWHHVAIVWNDDSGYDVTQTFLDGAAGPSESGSGPIASTAWDGKSFFMQAGGYWNTTAAVNDSFMSGSVAHVALYDSTLSSARITAHYSAALGWLGDTTGARLSRYLDYAGWPAAARDIDTGDSTVGAVDTQGVTVAQAALDLAEWEAGNLFIAPGGKVTFRDRSTRFNATSLATFGDGVGELPYEGDIEFDFDNTEIFNEVEVSRTGGATVRVTDATSQDHYFASDNLTQTIGIESDAQTIDRANYLLGAYKDPHLRVQKITIVPSSNTTLWPHALGRKIGDRITVKKHAGSATDISADFFIESIDHAVGDGTWTTSWLLSPAGSGVSDFYKVGDATYGYIEGSGGNVSYPIAF